MTLTERYIDEPPSEEIVNEEVTDEPGVEETVEEEEPSADPVAEESRDVEGGDSAEPEPETVAEASNDDNAGNYLATYDISGDTNKNLADDAAAEEPTEDHTAEENSNQTHVFLELFHQWGNLPPCPSKVAHKLLLPGIIRNQESGHPQPHVVRLASPLLRGLREHLLALPAEFLKVYFVFLFRFL